MIIDYIKCPLHRYTFSVKPIREWLEHEAKGHVLNLFAGKTKLSLDEVRVDADNTMLADHCMDAYDYVTSCLDTFDTVILDPPYAYRKSMEMYNGKVSSRFNAVKDELVKLVRPDGIVITFSYHSVSMGKGRGFEQVKILLLSHGGAQHDTIGVVERKMK